MCVFVFANIYFWFIKQSVENHGNSKNKQRHKSILIAHNVYDNGLYLLTTKNYTNLHLTNTLFYYQWHNFIAWNFDSTAETII